MSDAGRILEREAGGVARLTIDRPAKSNALSADLLTDLARRLRRLGARQELDLLVLQGPGLRASRRAPMLPSSPQAPRPCVGSWRR